MENLSRSIFKPIFEEMDLPNNEICKKCDAIDNAPLLPWIVGSKYFDTNERILFVGKPHRNGSRGEIIDSSRFIDWLVDDNSAYWGYTKEICKKIYGNSAPLDYACLTNIIKCSNVSGRSTIDNTTRLMAECCIIRNGVIFKEIEVLEPKHIIFYTHKLHNDTLDNLPFAISSETMTNKSYKVPCGKKKIGWWTRVAKTPWNDSVKILVTYHPERQKKYDYTKLITEWIKER